MPVVLCGCGASTLTEVHSQVFVKSCIFSGCHQGSAGAEGLSLEAPVHGRIVNVAAKGQGSMGRLLVVPGKPDESYLYLKLLQNPPAGAQMPNNADSLSDEKLALVRGWVAAGAKDD